LMVANVSAFFVLTKRIASIKALIKDRSLVFVIFALGRRCRCLLHSHWLDSHKAASSLVY
jgi:hypothetical protein